MDPMKSTINNQWPSSHIFTHSSSRLPATVHSPATVGLALLEEHHTPPLLLVDGVDIPARLNAHAASGASGRRAIHFRDVDELARVELEGGLGAQRLEVKLRVGVVEADELVERLRARVDGHAGRVWVDDEAVVGFGGFGAQGEFFVRVEFGVGFDGACGDGVIVYDLVEVCRDGGARAFDCWAARDVEVTMSKHD